MSKYLDYFRKDRNRIVKYQIVSLIDNQQSNGGRQKLGPRSGRKGDDSGGGRAV